MGPETYDENQDAFVRTASYYYRGPLDGINLGVVLDYTLTSGSHVGDLIRHLQAYVRYDVIPCEEGLSEKENELRKESSYKAFAASLASLSSITYQSRRVKIEICALVIFGGLLMLDAVSYNLLESVKPIYNLIKTAGGEATVRFEQHYNGLGADVSNILDAEYLGIEVRESIRWQDELNDLCAVRDPSFIAERDAIPSTLTEVWDREVKLRLSRGSKDKKHSWQHAVDRRMLLPHV